MSWKGLLILPGVIGLLSCLPVSVHIAEDRRHVGGILGLGILDQLITKLVNLFQGWPVSICLLTDILRNDNRQYERF